MAKFSFIRFMGRFKNIDTGQKVNVRQGRRMGFGTDHLFYLYRGKRVFISQADFYSTPHKWIRI